MHQSLLALLSVALLAAWPGAAHAADITRLAIVSTLGEALTIVVHVPETGSHIDRHRRETVHLTGGEFDNTAIMAAEVAAKELLAPAQLENLLLATASAPNDTAAQDEPPFKPGPALQQALTSAGASHLLLISSQRGTNRIPRANTNAVNHYLAGLGFYVDHSVPVRRKDTQESGRGFLAPYAYMKVSLINLTTGAVERSESASAAMIVSAARDREHGDPWQALTANQKVVALQRLVNRETTRLTGQVLKAP